MESTIELQGSGRNKISNKKGDNCMMDKEYGKQPHEEAFGHIIGLSVWNIISRALFWNQWWAVIISVILGISTAVEVIKFLFDRDSRRSYQYHTDLDELTGTLIAMVIMNILAAMLFHHAWWAQIPSTVLGIVAFEKAYEYFMTLRYKRYVENTRVPTNPNKYIQKDAASYPIERNEPIQVKIIDASEEENKELYCPLCGSPRESGESRFCSACGYKYLE